MEIRPYRFDSGPVSHRQANASRSGSGPADATEHAAADSVAISEEVKQQQRRIQPVEEVKKAAGSSKLGDGVRRRDVQKVRSLEDRDMKKKAEQSTLRSNTHRQVERSKSSTASTAAASTTHSAVQSQTRVKFRHVGQTRGHQAALFNERRPVRPLTRQSYVQNLKATWSEATP